MARKLKEAKTYQEQIDNLIENHGLIITDRAIAEDILSNVNYYRLSAFGIGLKQAVDKEKYQTGITLEHIYHLYQFDSELRNILTPLIEWIEIAFRTKMAYQLAMAYGPEGYRDNSHFIKKTDNNGNDIFQKTIDQLDTEIRHQTNLPCVKHHIVEYGGHFPVWAAVELFSFGMICSLYSVCTNQDKKKVATEFQVTPKHLHGWMMTLLELRNMCAHYNRIYNMFFKQTPYLEPKYRMYSGNKLFPKLLVIKTLVKKDMWDQFVNRLQNLLRKYPEVKVSFMGFPKEWLTVLKSV